MTWDYLQQTAKAFCFSSNSQHVYIYRTLTMQCSYLLVILRYIENTFVRYRYIEAYRIVCLNIDFIDMS